MNLGEPIVVTYQLSEAGQAILYGDGSEVAHAQWRGHGKLEWDGPWAARRRRAGSHELSVVGLDLAGNVGPQSEPSRLSSFPASRPAPAARSARRA